MRTTGKFLDPAGQVDLRHLFRRPRQLESPPRSRWGCGFTAAVGRGYQLRWEVRDNIVGVQRVTGPHRGDRPGPPHELIYKHLFSIDHRVRRGAGAAARETVLRRERVLSEERARGRSGERPRGHSGRWWSHPVRREAEGSRAGRRGAHSRPAGPGDDGGAGRAAASRGQRARGRRLAARSPHRPDVRPGLGALGGIYTAVVESPGPGGLRRLGHALRFRIADPGARGRVWSKPTPVLPQSDGRRGRRAALRRLRPRLRGGIAASLPPAISAPSASTDRSGSVSSLWSRCGLWRTRTCSSST